MKLADVREKAGRPPKQLCHWRGQNVVRCLGCCYCATFRRGSDHPSNTHWMEGKKSVRFFQPYVGPKYESQRVSGLKVLCLGESHYLYPGTTYKQEMVPDLTLQIVKHQVFGEGKHPFFGKVTTMISEASDQSSPEDIWSRIAFTNYIQDVLPRRDVQPRAEHWEEAKGPLVQTLRELRPDLLIALSARLWQPGKLPKIGTASELIASHPDYPQSWARSWRFGQTEAMYVNHPTGSRGWKLETWVPVVREVMGRCHREAHKPLM